MVTFEGKLDGFDWIFRRDGRVVFRFCKSVFELWYPGIKGAKTCRLRVSSKPKQGWDDWEFGANADWWVPRSDARVTLTSGTDRVALAIGRKLWIRIDR